MNFAVLGWNEDAHLLVTSALERGHALVAAFEVEDEAEALLRLAPDLRLHESWEGLLLGNRADVLVVGSARNEEVRADQLRKLVSAAVPLVLTIPACEAIVGYELDMIRRDSRCLIHSHSPLAAHPAMQRIREWEGSRADASGGGERAEQLVMERSLVARSRRSVFAQLARDTAVVRSLWGPITRVMAVGSANEDIFSSLDVHLTVGDGRVARWSLMPAASASRATLRLVRGSEAISLNMPERAEWTLEWVGVAGRVERIPNWGAASATWVEMEQRLAGGDDALPSRFSDSCRDIEVAETAARSLTRGKGYEIYNEDHTERSAFMGIMAAGGCLLLLASLLGLILVAVASSVGLPGVGAWLGSWPGILLTVLGIFLLLQLLLGVAADEKKSTG